MDHVWNALTIEFALEKLLWGKLMMYGMGGVGRNVKQLAINLGPGTGQVSDFCLTDHLGFITFDADFDRSDLPPFEIWASNAENVIV